MQNGPKNGMWPSPFNSAVGERPLAGRQILFADCTLRDGEQQAGVVFDRAAKVQIAKALDSLGIYEIEAGTVASAEEDRKAVADMCEAGLKSKISVLCRGMTGDIDMAVDLGVWAIRISFPVSPLERKYKLKGIGDDEYLKRALELSEYARNKGVKVIFSPYDTTRAELPFLHRLAAELEKAGTVDRLRVVDTTGCALPGAIRFLVGQIRGAAPKLPIEIHCHDDLGLACANTLAGLEAGADFASTTINGIGERCGNAPTEEVAMALEVLYGVKTRLDLSQLKSISQLVAKLSGVTPQVNKAVIGEGSFRHESGMAVAGLLHDPFTCEPYEPAIVGQQRSIMVGKKSGLMSISHKVKEMGLPVPEDRLPAVLNQVKEAAVARHRALTDDEFLGVVNAVMQ